MGLYNDKYVSFVIENYEDIKALFEIYDHAEEKFFSLLKSEVKGYIYDVINQMEDVLYEDDDGEGWPWWYSPKVLDYEADTGLYAGWYQVNKKTASFPSGNPEDASYLYIAVSATRYKKKSDKKEYIDKWVGIINKNSKKIKEKGCKIVIPVDYEDPYLVKYPLHREINMTTLANKERFEKLVKKAVRNFTELYLSIVRNLKSVP